MKKFTKIEDTIKSVSDSVEAVVGIKGTSTVMFIDKKLKPVAEKIFTDMNIEFDTYLTKQGETIPLFIVKPEDFSKVVKILDKTKGTL